jgi:hypothetical protein
MHTMFWIQNSLGKTCMNWISLCWKSLNDAHFFPSNKYCNLQQRPLMLHDVVGISVHPH